MERKESRILVIDDEPMMADSLRQNLVEEGYTVDTAATGLKPSSCLIAARITWPSAIYNFLTWMVWPSYAT